MKNKAFVRLALLSLVAVCVVATQMEAAAESKTAPQAPAKAKLAAVTFKDTAYFHRWSQKAQHEFTPKGQEDLAKWSDMITFNYYVTVKDGEGLASAANAVLEAYKGGGGVIVRTDSKPATAERPAEHLIVVMFQTNDFLEAAFTCFKLHDGMGVGMTYSHRIYGQVDRAAVGAWFGANGPGIEDALMSFAGIPLLKDLPQ